MGIKKRQEEYHEKFLTWQFFDFSCEGFFVEVGAFHSKELSQTWLLEKMGWKGILIEPLPENADELRKNRPLSKVYQTAVTCPGKEGECTFYVNKDCSALIPNIIDNVRQYPQQIKVSAATLDDILEKEGNPEIDFLSIDVEGTELDCMNGFNIGKYQPKLILTEDIVLNLNLHRWFLSKGYRLFKRTQLNNWYVPNECANYPSFWEKIRLFRKMYLGTHLRAWKFRKEKERLENLK